MCNSNFLFNSILSRILSLIDSKSWHAGAESDHDRIQVETRRNERELRESEKSVSIAKFEDLAKRFPQMRATRRTNGVRVQHSYTWYVRI